MKKRKIIVISLAVILAVALATGGTLAYLNGTSITATNEAENDFNWVSLTETDTPDTITYDSDDNIINTGYEIIPGTSQDKDPTVKVSYSVDSYVYVAVTDTSGGLITWDVASGWTLLTGTDTYDANGNLTSAVYYRLVQEADTGATSGTSGNVNYYMNSFSVLDGDSISYSSSITNSQIATFDGSGNPTFLNTDIKLTFQAYIMQADISGTDGNNETTVQCWQAMAGENGLGVAAINGALYLSLDAALAAAADGETVTLLTDIAETSAVTYSDSSRSVTLDLNGYTVSNSGSDAYVLSVSGGTLTIADSAGNGAITGSAESSQVGVQMTGGTLNISGGTVSGYAGILTAGGTLNISGGTVKGLSEEYDTMSVYFTGKSSNVTAYKDRVEDYNSAANGSGIIVVAGYDANLAVNISGGTVTTENHDDNYDICVVQVTGQDENAYGVNITVTGGTFGGDAGECQNIYLACDWGYTGDEYADGAYEYSWITLTDSNYLLGGVVGKYFSGSWAIGVNGFSPY